MKIHFRRFGLFGLAAFAAIHAAPCCATTYQASVSLGANLGTLTYTVVINTKTAPCEGKNWTASEYTYESFVFVPTVGASQPLTDLSTYYDYYPPEDKSCYQSSAGPTVIYSGEGYTLSVTPRLDGVTPAITVPGYINPKYIVVGVIYAPPAGVVSGGVAKGTVSYTDSDLVSSTITSKNSFLSSYTESSVGSFSDSIQGWASGSITSGASSSYTTSTTTTDSTAVTVQKTSTTVLGVNGPLCPYCGVDHDYDQIGVWVNPVQLFTLGNVVGVQPNGYGYSTLDQPGMDVYWVYAGELNGNIPVRSSTTTEFARAWAAGEVWPSGQGPGLTSQDEQYILQADPYWNCTYESPWTNGETSPCAKPPDATRFTESGGDQSFPYTQAGVGASPGYTTYTFSYTDTDTQGTDVTYVTSQTYGTETTFSASLFGFGFSATMSQSSTITDTYETSSQFTSSNTTTASATIWQVPCNVVDDACSPVYPPPNAYDPITCTAITTLGQAFGQGYTMYIYQDNLFGTFLMEPYGQ